MTPEPQTEGRGQGPGRGNAAVIAALLAELDALGVREFCVCAGARNVALVDALAGRAAGRSSMVLYNFFEERSAAFFALGRVMETRRPVAVVTTSGTAVAELFPAVMEAHYQALPLVLVTADRPSCYRGSGAPQAVEQKGIFGSYVVREAEIECADGLGFMMWDGVRLDGGPVHFNVCLEEGLSGGCGVQHGAAWSLPEEDKVQDLHRHDWREFWSTEGSLAVLASGIHPEDVPVARDFLLKLQAPVCAEATSNLPAVEALQPLLVHGGEQALKQLDARRVLRLGAVPSWRWWRDLEHRDEVSVLNVTHAPFRGLARSHGVSTVPWEMIKNAECGMRNAECRDSQTRATQDRLQGLLEKHPHSEPAWMRHLSRVIGPGATVFLGNSLPIREWNLAADLPESGTRFFANRGANGIDGLVSTWLGVGAGTGGSWLIVGDLSALYDLSAPWILPQLRAAKRRIVVINNGGGKIFSRVAWLKSAGAETQRVMENPHALGFEAWARMWGMDHRLISLPGELSDDDSGCAVWEVRPDAAQTEAFWREWA